MTIWAWQITGQASVLVVFFGSLPADRHGSSWIAGALVDRWNRKLVITLSDLAAGLGAVAIFALLKVGHLEGVAPLRHGRGGWPLLSPGARRRAPWPAAAPAAPTT